MTVPVLFQTSFISSSSFQNSTTSHHSFICAYHTGKSPSTTRIFLDTSLLIPGTRHPLPPSECSHIRSRRLQPGTNLTLLNGRGAVATAVLHNDASVTVLTNIQKPPQLPILSAAIGLPKSPQRADWLVEKLAELGAHHIRFCNSARAVVKTPAQGKLERWRRVAIAATKQCLRPDAPAVGYVSTFNDVVAMVEGTQLALLLSANGMPLLAEDSLNAFKDVEDVLLLAGPEGGFTEEEEQLLLESGARPIALGENRLRVETAIVAATAVVSQIAFRNSTHKSVGLGDTNLGRERLEDRL